MEIPIRGIVDNAGCELDHDDSPLEAKPGFCAFDGRDSYWCCRPHGMWPRPGIQQNSPCRSPTKNDHIPNSMLTLTTDANP
jgi:hypothetical protein